MTCHEVIALLQTFPPDQQVLVNGYEDGLDAVIGAQAVRHAPYATAGWYYGRYEETPDGQAAVLLQSTRRWSDDDM